jgi:predicted ATP-binding protein involved in virulence
MGEKEAKIQELTSLLEEKEEELQQRDTEFVEVQQKVITSEARMTTLLQEKSDLEATLEITTTNLAATTEQVNHFSLSLSLFSLS